MANDEIIVPPAWAVPPPPAAPPAPPAIDADEVITVPPGVGDSATLRTPIERERPTRPEIVFFPAAPGIPVPTQAPAAAAPPVSPATAAPPAPPTAAAPPAPPAPAPPAAAAAAPVEASDATVHVSRPNRSWRLTLAGLPAVVVGGPLYIGRNPAALPPLDRAALLTIDDPARSVSKTHALLDLEAGALWLTDLHSTNGSAVTDSAGLHTALEPGIRTVVAAGSTIELGDFAIQVEHG